LVSEKIRRAIVAAIFGFQILAYVRIKFSINYFREKRLSNLNTTVENQPALLLSLYEEEKLQLQKTIDEYLIEGDFLMAHYHSRALNRINRQLQTLKTLLDPLFEKKEFHRKNIDRLQNHLQTATADSLQAYFQMELQNALEALEELKQIESQPKIPVNTNLLDDTLKNLLDNNIKNLKLTLKKADNFYVRFSFSRKVLKVALPQIKQHTEKGILNEHRINGLKKLGFQVNENKNYLILTLTGDKEYILKRVKIILSRIVFDIFYYTEFRKGSYIEFTEKGHLRP
jgi:hypothetical protein